MTESTANTFIDDPSLMAFDALPANKLPHQAQVTLLLEELMEQMRKPSPALLDQMALAA